MRLPLLIVPFILLVGCRTSMESYIDRHGAPDIILERAGSDGRYVRYGEERPAWRWDRQVWYYITSNRKVIFDQGGLLRVEELGDEEYADLRRVRRRTTP